MPKRTPLNFDSQDLHKNLKTSAGQGVAAFFGPPVQHESGELPAEKIVFSNAAVRNEIRSSAPVSEIGASSGDVDPHVRTDARTDERPNDRTAERSGRLHKRSTKRHSFEFYEDQISRLKKLTLEKELRGESASMSDVVREALDDYFESSEKSEAEAERANARTDERALDRTDVRTEKSPT